MSIGTIASRRRDLFIAGGVLLFVVVFTATLLGGPNLIPLLVLAGMLGGLVKLASGPLSRWVARLRLGIAWKVLGAVSIMGVLMVSVSVASIEAMDYMHMELHKIQDLPGSGPADISRAVDELEGTQHGTFFSLMPLFSMLGAVFLFVFGIAIAVSIITPVRRMKEGMLRIAQGDFSQPVEVRNRDELGDLARGINETARELAQLQEATLAEERARALKEQITHVTMAQEEERRRISRELHDGLGPSLAAAANRLRGAQKMIASDPRQAERELEEVTQALKSNIQEIRQLIHDLRPLALDQLGLHGAIQQQLDRFETQAGVTLSVGIDPDITLDPLSELTVFRVLQECLGNIEKHAQASAVEVLLRRGDDDCWLAISDDGQGFDATTAMSGGSEGVGLIGMQERAELVGGTLSVEGRPGRGACVRLTIRGSRKKRTERGEELGTHPSIAR